MKVWNAVAIVGVKKCAIKNRFAQVVTVAAITVQLDRCRHNTTILGVRNRVSPQKWMAVPRHRHVVIAIEAKLDGDPQMPCRDRNCRINENRTGLFSTEAASNPSHLDEPVDCTVLLK